MKFTKTLAAIAAASLAVSSLAVSAFAADALVSMTVPENSKPQDAGQVNLWELPFDDSVEAWAGKVDKAVATITTEAYANGALGGNTVANNGWASSDQIESSEAGTHQWVWDSIGGLQTQDADGKSNGYFKVEVWWMNALGEEGNQTPATLTIDKVDFYDKAGDLLATYPAAADTDTKPAEPKPIQTKADISFTDKKTPSYTYTVKGDIDTLKVDVALSADAAAAQAGWNDWCSAGVAVKNPDGTVKYYQWGGASVNWSWDVDGDNVGETKDGVGTETWVGTIGADGGQISIPVVKGAVVDFYCLSWDKYKGVQYTFTINDEEAAVKPVEPVDPVDPVEPVDPPVDPGKTEDPAEPVAPADVKIANSGRTVIDSGLVRTNIINEWTGNDADVIADKAAFAGANKISVKFTVTNFTTPFKAWIAMADSKWECQFQGEGDKRNANAKCTPVEVTGNGTYVVTIDLDKVIDGVAFISVCTDLKAADGDAIPTIAIDQIKINEEITVKPGEPADPTKPSKPEDPTKPGESDPVKPGESDPVKPGDCSGEPVNPPTGAAVAVIPAVLAAAAVATTGIVLKKRSK